MAVAVGRTLGLYVTWRVAKSILGTLAMIFGLVFILDLVETLRRASDIEGAQIETIIGISLFRTPSIIEQTLPFAVLFGAMTAFLSLSRRLELTVVRAAGVSAWQFLAPVFALAIGIGILAATAFNPIAADLKARCDALEASLFGKRLAADSGATRWLRQTSTDGQAVIRATGSADGGTMLFGVTIFTFSPDGRFEERIEAAQARLSGGYWDLSDVRILAAGEEPTAHQNYKLATGLTADQVRQRFETAANVPFWQLPTAIALATAAGLDANEYRLQYQTLMARPLLLLAMILIAATVSMRFFRFGGIGAMIGGGVVAGFVLYVVTQMTEDLGAAGLVNPGLAAWTPALVGTLVGLAMLLNQEDG